MFVASCAVLGLLSQSFSLCIVVVVAGGGGGAGRSRKSGWHFFAAAAQPTAADAGGDLGMLGGVRVGISINY